MYVVHTESGQKHQKAFVAQYGGYVFLKSKTGLKKHYQETYGLVPTKLFLITEGANSLSLIRNYYEDQDK